MEKPRSGALILDGAYMALGAARNLAKYQVPVWIVDHELSIACYSRRVQGFYSYASDATDEQIVEFLLRLAGEQGFEQVVLFPDSDRTVKLLAQQRERLRQRYIVNSLPWEVIQYFYDKRLTSQLAQQQGVPTPFCLTVPSLEDLDPHNLTFPLVLKPAFSTLLRDVTGKKAFRVDSLDELKSVFPVVTLFARPEEILIQEYLPGHSRNLYSCCGYFKDGLPRYSLEVRRSRQYPPDFGYNSTYVETVQIPELKALAERLMQPTGYSGLAEVEFMYNERSQRYELLEVNPRIWGFHTIAIRAGMDLPYYAYLDALGEPLPPPHAAVDARWVRMITDTSASWKLIRSGSLSLGAYLRSFSGNLEFATLSLSDPLPAIMEVLIKARDRLTRKREETPPGSSI